VHVRSAPKRERGLAMAPIAVMTIPRVDRLFTRDGIRNL
jgi:hypothetical protein